MFGFLFRAGSGLHTWEREKENSGIISQSCTWLQLLEWDDLKQ